MLESGSCRKAHRPTVLAKNIMDACVTFIVVWAQVFTGSFTGYVPSIVLDEQGLGLETPL